MTSRDKGEHEDVVEEVEEQDVEADENDVVVFIFVIIIILNTLPVDFYIIGRLFLHNRPVM